MAIKSQNINNDPQLRGLVARQAFDYFEEYKDPDITYNGDIYAGVYDAYALLTEETKGDTTIRFNQFWGHSDAVRSVEHSKDGNTIYSAGSDGQVLKWNMSSREKQVIFRQEDVQRVVNVSPNERYLAMGTDNNNILLYNLRSGGAPTQIEGHTGGTVYDLVFMPDNSGFISSGEDGRILKSDFSTTEEILSVNSPVKAMAISPDGKTLACGAWNGDVYLVDLGSPEYVTTKIWQKDAQPVEAVAFDHTGKRIAFGDYDGNIIIWDLEKKQQSGPTLTGFTSPITDVEFSPSSRLLAGSSRDQTVRFWDLENPYDLPTVLDDHDDWVWDISFNPDGEHIASACADGLVRNFPLKSEEMAVEIDQHLDYGGMSTTEWYQYVDEMIPYETTVEGLPPRTGR
jgi:WD40 repeat protein